MMVMVVVDVAKWDLVCFQVIWFKVKGCERHENLRGQLSLFRAETKEKSTWGRGGLVVAQVTQQGATMDQL